MPSQRALGSNGMLKDSFPFLPELEQDVFGESASEPEGNEVGSTFALQVGKGSASMKA